MKGSGKKIRLFFMRNANKGIPNLMQYIALGNAIVLIFSLFNGGSALYDLLCFDKSKILEGQVWRLISYVFTQSTGTTLGLISLYFFYLLGHHVELRMGTLRFNFFYLSGVILMDVFAMIFCPEIPDTVFSFKQATFLTATVPMYMNMAFYLHLSLLLTFATTNPDSQFYIFFLIPIRAWVIALVYLLLVFVSIFNLSYPVMYFPHNLFPLVALANYLIFMGKDIGNLLPLSIRVKLKRKKKTASAQEGPIRFSPRQNQQDNPYSHKCTVCGRTDRTNPELEFRYCSRCAGFHCYCSDHINNHTHIEE